MMRSASSNSGGFRQMCDVAGVDHEGRLPRQRFDLADRLLERGDRVRVGGLVEADMAVADLQEGEAGGHFRRLRRSMRPRDRGTPPAHSPKHARAGPSHAFQHFAAADTVAIVIVVWLIGGLPARHWARRPDRRMCGFIPACYGGAGSWLVWIFVGGRAR